MANEIILTPQGLAKLREELEELKGPERMRIAEAIREAKAHGDLKENAAYHEAKLNQSRLESRIANLQASLERAKVVERADPVAGIGLGATVTLEDLDYGDELTIELVGAFESEPGTNKISVGSPMGEAVVGKEIGDTIEVKAPGGVSKFKIISVVL